MEHILPTSDEYESNNTYWKDDTADPNIKLLERLLKSGHTFSIHDWPGSDFTCDKVHTPAENTVLKYYEAEVLRRQKKAELMAKRQRPDKEEGAVEPGETSARKQQKKSKKVKITTSTGGLTLSEAVEELKGFFQIELAQAIGRLNQCPPTTSRKKNSRKARPKRSPKMAEEKVSWSDGEEKTVHSNSGSEKLLYVEGVHEKTFAEYEGVGNVIRQVEHFQPEDTLGDNIGDHRRTKMVTDGHDDIEEYSNGQIAQPNGQSRADSPEIQDCVQLQHAESMVSTRFSCM